MKPVLLLDVVGLTPRLLPFMPALSQLGEAGWQVSLAPGLPAVTCPVQSSMVTGRTPRDHGVVANGWYFRELGEIHFWRQHNALVTAEKLWETARASRPGYWAANLCWWYAMGASTDQLVTPRPVYHADGRKSADCYARPPSLHDELTSRLGSFPLFQYWGPGASLASSRWIVDAARHVLAGGPPDLCLVYVPHLDYDLQRHGPHSLQATTAARAVDAVVAPLLADAEQHGVDVVVVSEYGVTPARTPVHVNRALREEGLLEVYTQAGMEYLDPWTSRAFAVADHQIAHVYVADECDRARARGIVEALDGVDVVLDREAQAQHHLDHPRSGELVAVAQPEAWFTYYYWVDDALAPDFARGVDIHRKPGYDPAELLLDPDDRWVKGRLALTLAKKRLGFRYATRTVPLDPSCVRGTHGRPPDATEDGPLLISSRALEAPVPDLLAATAVRDVVLHLQGLAPPGAFGYG